MGFLVFRERYNYRSGAVEVHAGVEESPRQGRRIVATGGAQPAVSDPDDVFDNRSSDNPLVRRWFGDRWIYAVYKEVSEFEVEPVTAWHREHR
jgi:hypothetical protein